VLFRRCPGPFFLTQQFVVSLHRRIILFRHSIPINGHHRSIRLQLQQLLTDSLFQLLQFAQQLGFYKIPLRLSSMASKFGPHGSSSIPHLSDSASQFLIIQDLLNFPQSI
jgi:hypothetical protein